MRTSLRLAFGMVACTMPHTAGTVLPVRVPERTVMGVMGWSRTSMATRNQHVTDANRRTVAAQIDSLLWADDRGRRNAN
jgi:integrase